jgi:hypothetical protein
LPVGFRRANNEVVGKAGYLAGIQQDNVARLLVTGGFYGKMGFFYRFQIATP